MTCPHCGLDPEKYELLRRTLIEVSEESNLPPYSQRYYQIERLKQLAIDILEETRDEPGIPQSQRHG